MNLINNWCIPLKFSSSFGKLFASHAGVRRTGFAKNGALSTSVLPLPTWIQIQYIQYNTKKFSAAQTVKCAHVCKHKRRPNSNANNRLLFISSKPQCKYNHGECITRNPTPKRNAPRHRLLHQNTLSAKSLCSLRNEVHSFFGRRCSH